MRQRRRGAKLLNRITAKAKLFAAFSATPVLLQTIHTSGTVSGRALNPQSQTVVIAGEVKAQILLSKPHAFTGQPVAVVVNFDIAPGWHVYGRPLPQDYTPVTVKFDNELLSEQSLNFPKPTPVKFKLLDETLPVYQGRFRVNGQIVLRQNLAPGKHSLSGTLGFQECNDNF